LKKNTYITLAITLSIISFLWILLTPVLFPVPQVTANIAAAHQGFAAPDFTLQTPDDVNISLSDFDGQPVLVIFWASWCSVCKRTMPGLQAVYEDYHDQGFEILAVNATFQDITASAIDYFQSQGYTYNILLDVNGLVSHSYQTHALPTSVLVGRDGIILDVIIGSGMSEGFLRSRLEQVFTDMN
jgi:peroxiredoxin